MRFRIEAPRSESLCATCRYANIVEGHEERERLFECGQMPDHSQPRFRVRSCTNYSDRRAPTLSAMMDVAWVLRTDRGRTRQMGFVPMRDLAKNERAKYQIDDPLSDW